MQERQKGDGWGIVRFGWLRHPPEFVAGIVYFAATLMLAVLFAMCVWLVVRVAGLVFLHSEPEAPDQINKLLLALAGIIGAPFVVWRVFIASKQNEIAQENVHTTLLTKAVEQLGAIREIKKQTKDGLSSNTEPNIEVRLGAIYSLEKLARDYARLHWPIMEIICAYIRENGNGPKVGEEADAEPYPMDFVVFPRVDVQAALTVVGRRSDVQRSQELPHQRVDLSGARLMGADLSGLDFRRANLSGSFLQFATLSNADISESSLNGADLSNAFLIKTLAHKADFSESTMRNATMQGAILSCARLCNSLIEEVAFTSADLRWVDFHYAKIKNADFKLADTDGALVSSCDLRTSTFGTDKIENAWGDNRTTLPEGVSRPANQRWSAEVVSRSHVAAWSLAAEKHCAAPSGRRS